MTDDNNSIFADLAARLAAQPEQLQPRPGSRLPGYRARPHEDHGVAGSLVDQLDALPRRLKGQRRAVLWVVALLGLSPLLWFGPISLIRAFAARQPLPEYYLLPVFISFVALIPASLVIRKLAPSAAAVRLKARIAAERRLSRAIDQLPPGRVLPLWDRVLPGTEFRVPLIAVTEHGIHVVITAVGGPWKQSGRDWVNESGKVLSPELAALTDGAHQVLYTVEEHPRMSHPRIVGRTIMVYCWVVETTQHFFTVPGPGTLPPTIGAVNICTITGFDEALENRLAATLSQEEAQLLHHLLDELAPPAPPPRST